MARVEGSKAFTRKGYVVDRRIFRVYFFCLVLPAILYALFSIGGSWTEVHVYVSCPADSPSVCRNPCYLGGDRCGQLYFKEYLLPGESYGTPPDPRLDAWERIIWGVVFAGAVVAFVVNHLVHNRGRPFSDLLPDVEVEEDDRH